MSQWHLQLEAELLGCRSLRWSHKIMYAYLRFRQGDNRASWPGLTTICADLGVAKNTVIKALRDLERVGLICAEKSRRGGRAQSNRYAVVPFATWQRNGSETAPFPDDQKGSESASQEVRQWRENGSETTPFPEDQEGSESVSEEAQHWHENSSDPAPFGDCRKGSRSAPKRVQKLHLNSSVSAPLVRQKGSDSAPEKNKKTNREKNNDHFERVTTVGQAGDSTTPPLRKSSPTQGPTGGESFERFWAAYPRKVGKKKCRAIWASLKPTADLAEQIIAAVEAYQRTEQWQREGGRFVPHPSTFLNQGRWEDEIPATPEPKRGDPDWLPDEAEADEILREAGAFV